VEQEQEVEAHVSVLRRDLVDGTMVLVVGSVLVRHLVLILALVWQPVLPFPLIGALELVPVVAWVVKQLFPV
jgi:hypothetical protein